MLACSLFCHPQGRSLHDGALNSVVVAPAAQRARPFEGEVTPMPRQAAVQYPRENDRHCVLCNKACNLVDRDHCDNGRVMLRHPVVGIVIVTQEELAEDRETQLGQITLILLNERDVHEADDEAPHVTV